MRVSSAMMVSPLFPKPREVWGGKTARIADRFRWKVSSDLREQQRLQPSVMAAVEELKWGRGQHTERQQPTAAPSTAAIPHHLVLYRHRILISPEKKKTKFASRNKMTRARESTDAKIVLWIRGLANRNQYQSITSISPPHPSFSPLFWFLMSLLYRRYTVRLLLLLLPFIRAGGDTEISAIPSSWTAQGKKENVHTQTNKKKGNEIERERNVGWSIPTRPSRIRPPGLAGCIQKEDQCQQQRGVLLI